MTDSGRERSRNLCSALVCLAAVTTSLFGFLSVSGCRNQEAAAVPEDPPLPLQVSTLPPTVWTATVPASSLAPAAPVGGYTIRPPQGYRLKITREDKKPSAYTRYEWSASPPASARMAVFVRKLDTTTFGGKTDVDLTRLIATRLIGNNVTSQFYDPPREGTINDLLFAATYGTTTPKAKDAPIHFFVYGSVQASAQRIVYVVGLAREPYQKTVPLMAASALTLKKQ